MSKPIVLVSEHLGDAALAWLAERSTLRQVPHNDPRFATAIEEAQGLVVRTYTKVDRSLLEHAPRLRVVGRAGAGLDNIDVASCLARGVAVVYTPDANTQAVVEYVLCLICDAMRPRPQLQTAVDPAIWNDLRETTLARRELAELTLGILGFGRVGQKLARIAGPLFSKVIFNDLLEIASERCSGATAVPVEELFTTSDVLSIHIDGRATNRGIVDKKFISQMQSDAVFINTSRGFVVDSFALASFLKANPTAQALLDVHEPEPFGADFPLLGLPSAHLFPHIASRTARAMENMSWVVRDVVAVLEGQEPRFPAPRS